MAVIAHTEQAVVSTGSVWLTGSELVHVISFLLQMGFREVGVPFPLASLNPLQANIAAHLSQLGLLAPFRSLRCNLPFAGVCSHMHTHAE